MASLWTAGDNSNVSNNQSLPPWITYKSELRVWFAIAMIIIIGGFLLNLSLVFVIISSKKLLRSSRILILNLVVCLTLLCAFGAPIINATTYDQSTNTLSLCRGISFVYLGLYFTVDWADLMISINRFVAIVFPHYYYRMIERRTLINFTRHFLDHSFHSMLVNVAWNYRSIWYVATMEQLWHCYKQNVRGYDSSGILYSHCSNGRLLCGDVFQDGTTNVVQSSRP